MTSQIDWLTVSETLAADSHRLHEEAQQFLRDGSIETATIKAHLSELTILLANALLRGIKVRQS